MSQAIQLRQRIKTIDTLRKMTHTMRLTSMSTHARLQRKGAEMGHYRTELGRLKDQLAPLITPITSAPAKQKTLCIVVGSQKGMCGTFNLRVTRFFEERHDPADRSLIITIGKKTTDLLGSKFRLLYAFNTFSATNFFAVSKELYQHITGPENYTSVTFYSNYSHTFFAQKISEQRLYVPQASYQALPASPEAPYTFDQSVNSIYYLLEHQYFKSLVEEILFKSLIAEHAARFISMDSSTTNADKILEVMRRDYNKPRQASITREITDLVGGIL
jgi:F-type H+-transporting ATPase subunit gamma